MILACGCRADYWDDNLDKLVPREEKYIAIIRHAGDGWESECDTAWEICNLGSYLEPEFFIPDHWWPLP